MSVLANFVWFLVGIVVAILVELALFGVAMAIYEVEKHDDNPEEMFKDCYEAGLNFLDDIR